MNVVAALLTLVGYSVNDTIVIFDRVRENLKLTRRRSLGAGLENLPGGSEKIQAIPVVAGQPIVLQPIAYFK